MTVAPPTDGRWLWNQRWTRGMSTAMIGRGDLGKTGALALRLPAGVREAFLVKYKTRLSEQHGVVQKEYVEVPDVLLKKPSELKTYCNRSHGDSGPQASSQMRG